MPQDQCTGFAQYVDDNNIDGLQQTNKNGKHPYSFFTMDTVQRATSSKKRIYIFFLLFWERVGQSRLSIRHYPSVPVHALPNRCIRSSKKKSMHQPITRSRPSNQKSTPKSMHQPIAKWILCICPEPEPHTNKHPCIAFRIINVYAYLRTIPDNRSSTRDLRGVPLNSSDQTPIAAKSRQQQFWIFHTSI